MRSLIASLLMKIGLRTQIEDWIVTNRCPALMLQSFIVGTDCLELLETVVDFFVIVVKVDCMIVGHRG